MPDAQQVKSREAVAQKEEYVRSFSAVLSVADNQTISEDMTVERSIVLCGSNSYEKRYYFNDEFGSLPDHIKRELQIMCVWFTEECGGILTMEYEEDGTLEFKFSTTEYDGYYDEIGADLKIKQYREEKRDLLEALELFYKTFYLGEDIGE